jgi:2-keto-3-deoxy-L-rhamnonate aldolase RhmA
MLPNLSQDLKTKLRNRQLVFGSWVSFSHPSITEIFSAQGFDFHAIDIEHTTISLEQAQRIIAASQYFSIPCLPRPVSHSNDYIKPLLDSGANGIIAPLINNAEDSQGIIDLMKFPPLGKRSFGVNRAHGYGSTFSNYILDWNQSSVFISQIESVAGLSNIQSILNNPDLDGVMIGPYDMSGSLGVPGQISHQKMLDAEKIIIEACESAHKSCGTQISEFSSENIEIAIDKGYTFIIASSDLFVLNSWAEKAGELMNSYRS